MRLAIGSRTGVALLSIGMALVFAGRSAAVTVQLGPAKDNTLIETPIGDSNGAGDGIYVGKVGINGGETRRRGLIAFDLTSIPSGSTINNVSLGLEMVQSPNLTGRLIVLHAASANWGEAGSNGSGQGSPATAGDATWLFTFFNTSPWATPGGDFAAGASAAALVSGAGSYVWTDTGMITDVQSWVNSPVTNFGWLLLGDETTGKTVKKFDSKEGFTPPVLTVDYTPSTSGVGPGQAAASVQFAAPWPTPGSAPVHLDFTLPRTAHVSLSIQDVAGRAVRHLENGSAEPSGRHVTPWDGRSDSGAALSPGVYLALLVVDGAAYTRRIALIH